MVCLHGGWQHPGGAAALYAAAAFMQLLQQQLCRVRPGGVELKGAKKSQGTKTTLEQ